MTSVFDCTLGNGLLFFVSVTVVGIIIYTKWAFSYWKNRGLICDYTQVINPFPPLKNLGVMGKNSYDLLKNQGCQHGGIYLCFTPKYFPVDPEFIKNVLQRDFDHFNERGFYFNEKDDPLSANLFALGGQRWKNLRSRLSPAFTSGKLRMMFDMLVECGQQMQNQVEKIHGKGQEVDIKDLAACYTIDVIGACAFGLDCNSFTNPDAEFKKYGKKVFEFVSLVRVAKVGFSFTLPNAARKLGVRLFDKESTDFFIKIVKDTLKFRLSNKVVRNDIMQLLIELNQGLDASEFEKEDNSTTIKEMAAQAFIFFAAGFETSSTTLSFCLYELALNKEIQDKARTEISDVLMKHQGRITYEALMDMKYLKQVIDDTHFLSAETLRKYPPVSFITRVCVKDYKVPSTDLVLEKGVEAIVSILGLHRDPDHYPNPDEFDPGRFSEENKQTRPSYTYLPFGEGPRKCIGLRFGLMQTTVGLVMLLKNYKFSLNKRTDVPLQLEPFSFTLIPESGVFLDVEKVY